MGRISCESESWLYSERNSNDSRLGFKSNDQWPKIKKKKNQVLLEGYVEEAIDEEDTEEGGCPKTVSRTKSLMDDDLDELKGCLDLGFGFSYDEIPEFCNTLPALELCYSMSQKFLDEHQRSPEAPSDPVPATDSCSSLNGPIANWKILSPG